MSAPAYRDPPEMVRLAAMLDRAKAAQLAGDDETAKKLHWQIIKTGKRTRDPRLKQACYATAAFYHGFIAYREHRYREAELLYRNAIGLGLANDWAWMNLGCALREQGKTVQSFEAFLKAAHINDQAVQTLTALGNAAYELGDEKTAANAWSRSLSRETTDPAERYDQAILALSLGAYEVGWRLHAERWNSPLFKAAHRPPPTPDWDGGRTHQRLMVYGEQGHGDAIMLLRWLPRVRELAPHMVLAIHTPLVRLCQLAWPDLDVTPMTEMPAHDCKVSLFDLPTLFHVASPDDLPDGVIFRAPPGTPPALPADRMAIGLVFAGGKGTHHDWRRSIDWRFFRWLMREVPEPAYVLLQPDRLDALTEEDRDRVILPALEDFADTALWMEHLDLLISVDTSAAHLAGALGLPCWQLTPRLADYRWGHRGEATPWYPWTRLFRQRRAQRWGEVFRRVALELDLLLRGDESRLLPKAEE